MGDVLADPEGTSLAAQLWIDAPSPVETSVVALTNADQPLPFEIELVSGLKVTCVGEAQYHLLRFEYESLPKSHWMLAMRMFRKAVHEPEFLKLATMSLETAFALEGVLAGTCAAINARHARQAARRTGSR